MSMFTCSVKVHMGTLKMLRALCLCTLVGLKSHKCYMLMQQLFLLMTVC